MATTAVVIPVKDGARWLAEVLEAVAREQPDEVLVIDSGSADGSVAHRARRRRHGAGDPARGVRPRPHAQPRARAHERRADRLPHAGRDAGPRLARRLPRGVRARRPRRRRVRPAPAAPRHEPDDRPRADRVLRRLQPRRRPRDPARPRRRLLAPRLPLERERRLPARRAGGDPLPRRAVRRGPGVRARPLRGRLAQGLPPGRGRPARARLPVERLHAAVLRRVPRAARDDRPRRADRRALDRARGARPGRPRPRLPRRPGRRRDRARASGRRARPPITAGGASSPRSARAPTGCPPAARRALSLEGRDDATGDDRRAGAADARAAASPAASCSPRSSTTRSHGAAPLLPAGPGRRRAHAAARRDRHPAVPQGQRRPRHDLPRSSARSSASATRARSGSTTRAARCTRRPRSSASGSAREFAALDAPVFVGFDDWYGADVALATGWQTVFPVLQLGATAGAGLLRAGPRARVLRDGRRAALGRRDVHEGPARDLREPVARGHRARALRRHGVGLPARPGPVRLPPARRRRAAATWSSSTGARSPRAAPSRSGCSRSPSCTAAARTRGSSSTATRSRSTRRSPTSTRASPRRSSSRGSTRRRPPACASR